MYSASSLEDAAALLLNLSFSLKICRTSHSLICVSILVIDSLQIRVVSLTTNECIQYCSKCVAVHQTCSKSLLVLLPRLRLRHI